MVAIAYANHKGGVGKSNLAVHTAGLYALAGHRVLTIDLDPQGNLIEAFGLTSQPGFDDAGAGMAEALIAGRALTPLSASTPQVARPGLFTVPGGQELNRVFTRMLRTFTAPATADNDELADETAYWLADSLAPIVDDFDVVIIDCPPGTEPLQVLGLTAADFAVFPVGADISERKGVRLISNVFSTVRERYNPQLRLAGVVPMRVKKVQQRTELAKLRERLTSDFGGDASIVFDSWIAEAATAAWQARARGLLVHELEDRRADAARERLVDLRAGRAPTRGIADSAEGLAADYTNVAAELLERMSLLASGASLSDREAVASR